jgi:hypothetical protein
MAQHRGQLTALKSLSACELPVGQRRDRAALFAAREGSGDGVTAQTMA